MLQLTTRQQKIMEYLRDNRTLHKGRHAVKSEVAHKYAMFFELTALAQVGAISRDGDGRWYYLNTSSIAPSAEMFSGERFGGTTPITAAPITAAPITAEQERIARLYIAARLNADELRAVVQAQALTMSPYGLKYLQDSVNCFYEAVEIEARRARELFDLLSDQTYD